jgi:leucyl aminopeptidase (aminopeptidase T)
MNIDVKFIDENTVEIVGSLSWSPPRPPSHLKEVRTGDDVAAEFKKKYPSYEVERVVGTHKIWNCKSEAHSRGNWTLKVSKKQKKAAAQPAAKKSPPKRETKKGA